MPAPDPLEPRVPPPDTGVPAPAPASRPSPRVVLALAIAATATAALLYGLEPDALVTAYLVHVFPRIAAVLGPCVRACPVPLTDVLEVALGLAVLAHLARHAVRVARRRERPREAARALGLGLVGLVSALFLVAVPSGLYVVGRKTVEARLGLDPSRVAAEDLVAAALRLSEPLVAARRALGKVPRLATMPAGEWLARGPRADFPIEPAAVDASARAAASEAVRALEHREFGTFVSPRLPFPDTLLHREGVCGRTIPLTGEVTVSPYLSAVEWATVLTHEDTHAAGVIREREADFYAFVGGARSPLPLLRYATLLSARCRLCEAAKNAGVEDAWDRARAALPGDVEHEIEVLGSLYRERAFAPGGRIELAEEPAGEAPEVVQVTEGDAPGTAPIAVYKAVSASAGLPLNYDSCVPLIAVWVLARGT